MVLFQTRDLSQIVVDRSHMYMEQNPRAISFK